MGLLSYGAGTGGQNGRTDLSGGQTGRSGSEKSVPSEGKCPKWIGEPVRTKGEREGKSLGEEADRMEERVVQAVTRANGSKDRSAGAYVCCLRRDKGGAHERGGFGWGALTVILLKDRSSVTVCG